MGTSALSEIKGIIIFLKYNDCNYEINIYVSTGSLELMFRPLHSPTLSALFFRKVVIAALMGAAFLATPLTATRTRAQATAATIGVPVSATAIEAKGETVEQRIIGLNARG